MARLEGRAFAVIDAPIVHVYGVAANLENGPEWQPELKRVKVLEWDSNRRHSLGQHEIDGRVRILTVAARFVFNEPFGMHWTQEEGDFAGLHGRWSFEELGDQTRATCEMRIDIGGMLGLALRGPIVGALRHQLVDGIPARLKQFVEDGGR